MRYLKLGWTKVVAVYHLFLRYMRGEQWNLPAQTPESAVQSAMRDRVRQWLPFYRDPNLVHPLTPVVIALKAGKAHPHREMPYAMARRPKSNLHRKTPRRLVGRPVLTKYPSLNVYGDTEWAPGYVRREEMLASRRKVREAQ